MSIANRIRDLDQVSKDKNSAVSWPAVRLLGVLSEHHFAALIAAIEQSGHGSGLCTVECVTCLALNAIEAELDAAEGP